LGTIKFEVEKWIYNLLSDLKNKVLIISSEFPPGPGGIGHHAWFLAKELSLIENLEIEVICPKDYSSEEKVLIFDRKANFVIHRFERIKGITQIIRVLKLIKLLKSRNYTHVWSTGKFALWMIWIQKLYSKKSKTLCIIHGSEVNLSNSFLRRFTHLSIKQFQTIVAVSNFTKSLLPGWILRTHNNLHVIPNGLDKSDYIVSNRLRLAGSPVLLTVGHVSPRKGQHRLIKALPKIIQKYPDVHYHIVGRAIDREKLELLSEDLGVKKYITFHGSVVEHKSLWDYYSSSDIFVLLSENQRNGDVEGFGIVALEANACGTPVLGAKYCGVEEAVSHLKSGCLVNGDDVNEILEGIEFCLKNKQFLHDKSLEWSERFNWSKISVYFEGLI